MEKPKIILPGGSGFLGRTLAAWFRKRGFRVIVLSRRDHEMVDAEVLVWDARSLGEWQACLEGAVAVVNLAGRTVNCRYNEVNRRQMIESRTLSTAVLGEALAKCENPPPVWLNSSTATIYRHRYDEANTESDGLYGAEKEAKDAFSLEVAHAWEDSFERAYQDYGLEMTRGVVLRTAMVFGKESGGVYEALRKLARMGLGGKMGHGRQFVSWMHETDFCRAIQWLIENENAVGVYNLTAPNPLLNKEMMAGLRKVLKVSFGLPAARWMLEMGAFFLRTETELIVKSRRVVPARLQAEGFVFDYPDFFTAIKSLEEATK